MKIRDAAVAGLFYESDGDRLQQHIGELLREAKQPALSAPQALIVPHAGYIYSGQTAASAYRQLEPLKERIKRVVLFGPAHRVYLEGMAVPSVDAFATPLGQVALDKQSLELARTLPDVCVSDEAHLAEHSLEVQLPFLQNILQDFSLVPIVVGRCEADKVATVMDALWGGPETLVVVSTDLSHFHAYEEALQLDGLTCDRLLAKETSLVGTQACGAYALNGLMNSCHVKDLQVELLEYCNSGDTAGDRKRVVGYGAFVLH